MYIPYDPCNDCKRKEMCNKCTHKALQINYKRVLNALTKEKLKANTPKER